MEASQYISILIAIFFVWDYARYTRCLTLNDSGTQTGAKEARDYRSMAASQLLRDVVAILDRGKVLYVLYLHVQAFIC